MCMQVSSCYILIKNEMKLAMVTSIMLLAMAVSHDSVAFGEKEKKNM